jgi:acyl-CoA synthetase (AMP-forming)/AMP-acid ligase II
MPATPGLLNLGETLSAHARLTPEKIGASDLERQLTFALWDVRARRLANALLGLGLAKGDRVAVLAYNCLEWVEIYAAAAKAGLVVVPINFRLIAREALYIVEDADCAALIVQDELVGIVEEIAPQLSIKQDRRVHFGKRAPAGFRDYEALIAAAASRSPDFRVGPSDPSVFMYTSGTTGRPKGVVRTHRGGALLGLVTNVELKLDRDDSALLVMPMCHANSLYFFGAFAQMGAATHIYSRKSFDPEHAIRALAETRASFTSLVPTHYIMMLGLSQAARAKLDLGGVEKLMISSAPARPDTKRAVMEMFTNSGLYELYGSSEAGWVTMLHPDEQFTHLGTVGRECVGSAPIRILDEAGVEVADGEPGELYSCNPYTFEGYWKLPEKTAEAFRGDYCTVGDMALRDGDGFIRLIDRKKNLIISGGENIYPSEVETVIGAHRQVRDVAVVGVADAKWGERVHAVVVLHEGETLSEAELIDWTREKLAGYKRPRSVSFFAEADMPRTATGKILHRELRAKLNASRQDEGTP